MATMTTTRAYERSHGRKPRGEGGWGFQRSTTEVAFDGDRYGDVHFFFGTYTEARKAAVEAMSDAAVVAVMP